MPNRMAHEIPTSNVLAWSAHAANVESLPEEELAADPDEPPDERPQAMSPATKRFQKSTVRRAANTQSSLLTKALQSHSEDDSFDGYQNPPYSRRRRSINSNFSLASADLSCDTGLTTPARTNSPSPRLPQVGFAPVVPGLVPGLVVTHDATKTAETPLGEEEKRRSISFACVAKPLPSPANGEVPPPPKPTIAAAGDAPKRPCIKFVCVGRPPAVQQPAVKPPQDPTAPSNKNRTLSPSYSRKCRSPSTHSRTARSVTPRRTADTPAVRFRNYLTADLKDLDNESSEFHEFARDEIREEDWIRRDQAKANSGRRLTIDDTLKKELAIRRLGKEVEDEVAQEDAEDGAGDDNEEAEADEADLEDPEGVDEDEAEPDFEDDHSGYGSDDDNSSAGYHTDEEVGFAESDDDEDDDLDLWTTGQSGLQSGSTAVGMESVQRRYSCEFSDSSAFSPGHVRQIRQKIHRHSPRSAPRADTPELPDSTDFVCGTLDEDRPLEEAYMSAIAAKKEKEKLRVIPQDIDPSFPTSEPEDEGDDHFKPLYRNSDEHVWLHGEIEDLDLEDDRAERRKKKVDSPKRYHSPPPRRHHSPPQRLRGRSPPPPSRRLTEKHSPVRCLRSPAPALASHHTTEASAQPSPVAPRPAGGRHVTFQALPFRPGGLTHTKSLPRAPAILAHNYPKTIHHRRVSGGGKSGAAAAAARGRHVRGAIDIVKGLEQRRQRRTEKFKEKMCNRARKGLSHEKRPQPGKGAERMREIGLLMAGKIGPGNYVLSV